MKLRVPRARRDTCQTDIDFIYLEYNDFISDGLVERHTSLTLWDSPLGGQTQRRYHRVFFPARPSPFFWGFCLFVFPGGCVATAESLGDRTRYSRCWDLLSNHRSSGTPPSYAPWALCHHYISSNPPSCGPNLAPNETKSTQSQKRNVPDRYGPVSEKKYIKYFLDFFFLKASLMLNGLFIGTLCRILLFAKLCWVQRLYMQLFQIMRFCFKNLNGKKNEFEYFLKMH